MTPGVDEVELEQRLTRIEEGQKTTQASVDALRVDLTRYFDAQNKRLDGHGTRIRQVEQGSARQEEQIGNLQKGLTAWNGLNSLGALIAGIIGWRM